MSELTETATYLSTPIADQATATAGDVTVHDSTFHCMGTDIRLCVGEASMSGASSAEAAADAQMFLEHFDRTLSRFKTGSELNRLNASHKRRVDVSPLTVRLVKAGIWAANATGGLVDFTLVDEIESSGYVRSLDGVEPAALRDALAVAANRKPAQPHPRSSWQTVSVNEHHNRVRRPAGVRLDSGGCGKGLAADMVADQLVAHERFLIDCGGDIRVRSVDMRDDPYEIDLEHPITRKLCHTLRVWRGGVATSSLSNRIWQLPDGSFSHHLIDPLTGKPAWTGLISVTAWGPSALAAETIAKAALLSGPDAARRTLAFVGGVLIHDSGEIEVIDGVSEFAQFSDPAVVA